MLYTHLRRKTVAGAFARAMVGLMTTADYALIVSICSAFVSIASFVWNVWSKFLYPRARLRVTFAVMVILDGYHRQDHAISLRATNYGPTDLILTQIIGRYRLPWDWRRFRRPWQMTIFKTIPEQDIGSDEPRGIIGLGQTVKLGVGESHSSYLIYKHEGFRDSKFIDVGFADAFNRIHWAPRDQVRKVRMSVIKEAFAEDPT